MSQANAKAEAAFAEARKFFEQSRFDDAIKSLDASIAHQPSARAWRIKGYIHKLNGRLDDAAQALESALEIDIKDHNSLALLAEVRMAQEDAAQAIGLYVMAIAAKPDDISYKENFLLLAGALPFTQHNPQAAEALVNCLKTPEVECTGAQILWLSLFETAPNVRDLYKVKPSAIGPVFDASGFGAKADLSPLDNDLFIEGLQRLAIYHPAFDQFLTHLRRHLLLNIGAGKMAAQHMRLAAALAHYCYFTEYMFDVKPDEQAAADALAAQLKAAPDAAAACLYGCYAPLSALDNAAAIAQKLRGTDGNGNVFSSLAQTQIDDPAALEADKASIPALTLIDDGVSVLVRAQYEEFPYPRWKKITGMKKEAEVADVLSRPNLHVLVAGCGTGREAITAATALKDSQVLAIDLSLTSLAYARSRAAQLGVKNITFKQADITKLPEALSPASFDYITSSGVLHHMADPEGGLKILTSLLKPDGVMRIALYSELGRKAVVAGRDAIAKGGYTGTADSMRSFRRDMPRLLPAHTVMDLMGFGDYYHLSMFRDLLFHEQEHRFDIPRIRRALDDCGLQFIKFGTKKAMDALYAQAYPDGVHRLERWQELEQKNPSLFREMYFIWCRKKA